MQPTAHDKLVRAAAEEFYAHGIHATGIDTITARAGVAKKSMYNNFRSKEELVLTYIEHRHQEWLDLFAARAEHLTDPRQRCLAVFDAYLDHTHADYPEGFRGCGLLNVAGELPVGHPGRELVRRHKAEIEQIFVNELRELPDAADDATHLAELLSFLLEGAISVAGLEGDDTRVRHARALAAEVVGAL